MYILIKFVTKEGEEEVLLSSDNGEECSFISTDKLIPINMNKNPMGYVVEYLHQNADSITFVHEGILRSLKEEYEILNKNGLENKENPAFDFLKDKKILPSEEINKQILRKTISAFESYNLIERDKYILIANTDFHLTKSTEREIIDEIADQLSIYDSYGSALSSWIDDIHSDINDIGLYSDGEYDFYLTGEELEYLGFGEELLRQKEEYCNNSKDEKEIEPDI